MQSFEKNQLVSVVYQKAEDAPKKGYKGVVDTVKDDMVVVALLGEDDLPTGAYRSFKFEKIISSTDGGKVSTHYLDGIR